MELQLPLPVLQSRGEFFGPMDTTAIDDHHNFFSSFAGDGHHLMKILPEVLGIKIGHDFIEDACGPILHGANDVEQYLASDPAPGAIAQPCLALQALVAFDLTRTQRPCGQTRALGFPPPARPREGKTPEDGLIFIEQNDLATACPVCEGGECERGRGEVRRVGLKAAGGAAIAQGIFFKTPRTLHTTTLHSYPFSPRSVRYKEWHEKKSDGLSGVRYTASASQTGKETR